MDLRVQFRETNTETPGQVLPSGTSDDTLNVVLDGARLRGRNGFAVLSTSLGSAILNMTTARFANGDIYLVAKCADTFLYFRKMYPADAGSWTKITDKWTGHNTTDRGWFFMHSDRLHYFDRVGGTKWHPTAGTFKAGIACATVPAIEVAAGGEKEGFYFVYGVKYNSVTHEMSAGSSPASSALETRISAGYGGINVTNWGTIKAADTNYEHDKAGVCSTAGDQHVGLGAGSDSPNHVAWLDSLNSLTASALSLNKADAVHQPKDRMTNAGGIPPASRLGACNGDRAVYLDLYPAGASIPGLIGFSISGSPCSVPEEVTYTVGGDSTTFVPIPWRGYVNTGIPGKITACGFLGHRFLAFTETGTQWLIPLADGRLRAAEGDPSCGCSAEGAAVSTGKSVHAYGGSAWLRITDRGIERLNRYRFTPTLNLVPAAYRSVGAAGFYSYRDEVWIAVAKNGGTKAQRILIVDEARSALVGIFEPTNLSTAGITAMCELPLPSGPVMAVALDTGAVLTYPGTAYLDGSTAYATAWQGYAGQEYRGSDWHLKRVALSVGANGSAFNLAVTGLRSSAENTAAEARTITDAEGRVGREGAMFDPYREGNLFRIRINSTTAQSPNWAINDVVLSMEQTGRT